VIRSAPILDGSTDRDSISGDKVDFTETWLRGACDPESGTAQAVLESRLVEVQLLQLTVGRRPSGLQADRDCHVLVTQDVVNSLHPEIRQD
jgi:hypothetical protein